VCHPQYGCALKVVNFNHKEIVGVLEVSAVTVRRDWVFAKAWLYNELQDVA